VVNGGEKLTIRARVRTLTGYSAPHAVQAARPDGWHESK
jgi:hypothetical protein